MNRLLTPSTLVLCIAILLSGCMKDKCSTTYTYFKPVFKTIEEVRANIKSNAPQPVERAGKIFLRGKYIFLNEVDRGIHIIDNTNPSSPQNLAFIDIPGNMDMAVKGNYLYADAYTDLVTVDISNPLDAKLLSVTTNSFPHRYYYASFSSDHSLIIVDWEKRDTTVSIDCKNGGMWGVDFGNGPIWYNMETVGNRFNFNSTSYASNSNASPFGMGGSMARFAIADNHLYTVGMDNLVTYSLQSPGQPARVNEQQVGFNIETIFPFKNNLFIGSATGMFIYTLDAGGKAQAEGSFSHVVSCDPVIADEQYAYVTLRSGNFCAGTANQLDVLDINNIKSPALLKTYPMDNPHGLSKEGNILFVCEGTAGLKVFDATDVNELKQIDHVTGINAFDVIAWNGIAIVVTPEGLHQYDYSSPSNLTLLSKIDIN